MLNSSLIIHSFLKGGLFDDIIAEKPKPAKEQKLPQAPPKSESESESESEEDMKPQGTYT